ncbi:MAG: ATPase domain-containing protein [Candidatus Bathyarchaeia archaeon]
MNRISTGNVVLDSILNGGFSAGSLISVSGPPGSGKTTFAANWIYNGVKKFSGNGLYVSFIEGRKSFIKNMCDLTLDFEKLEHEGKFRFLEMVTVKEIGITDIFEQILHEIRDINATMLVIDSFSAISQVIEKPSDVRIIVHNILGKIIKGMGCTTMVIIEKTNINETESIEFLSDYLIHLNYDEINGALLRYLKILKTRGTEILWPLLTFTLKNGFKVFQPLIMGGLPEPTKRFKLVPHTNEYYSSGISDLDKIIGSMFKRGSYNLLEFEKNVALTPERLFRVTVSNILNQGGYVIILPPQGLSALTVWNSLKSFVYEEALKHNLKIVDFKAAPVETIEPYTILFEGKSLKEDMISFWNAISEFRYRSNRPIFSVVGFDTLEYMYGKDKLLKILGEDLAKIRNFKDVRLNIIRPECALTNHLSSLADSHLVIKEIHGVIFLQGIKPKTPLLNIEVHINGETEIKLIPVV